MKIVTNNPYKSPTTQTKSSIPPKRFGAWFDFALLLSIAAIVIGIGLFFLLQEQLFVLDRPKIGEAFPHN
ncbi:MAG: hypothetical protein QM811_16280 [Pirellulales bacterium]